LRCNLPVGSAESRIKFPRVDRDGDRRWGVVLTLPIALPSRSATASTGIQVELLCLPGFPVFRKAGRISGCPERFLRDDPRGLMMAMTVSGGPAEAGDNNLRLELPDDANKIPKHRVMAPFLKSLFGALRETKLVNRREELLGMVGTARSEKLFR